MIIELPPPLTLVVSKPATIREAPVKPKAVEPIALLGGRNGPAG